MGIFGTILGGLGNAFKFISPALGAAASLIGSGLMVNYQKHVQNRTWQREDTAVQRRVRDLQSAGMSPVLAAGSSASSSNPISVYRGDEASRALDAINMVLDFQKRQADIGVTKAQKALINASLKGKEKTNRMMDLNYLNALENRKMENTLGLRHGDSMPWGMKSLNSLTTILQRLREQSLDVNNIPKDKKGNYILSPKQAELYKEWAND